MRKLHHLYPLPVDELQGGEYQLGAAIRLRFGQVVYQPLRVDGLEPLQGERRAGTVAQQPLEPGPVIGLDPDRGIVLMKSAKSILALTGWLPVPAAVAPIVYAPKCYF